MGIKKVIMFLVFVFSAPLLFSQSKPPKWFNEDRFLDNKEANIVYSSGMATRKNEEEAMRIAEYNAYKKLKRRLGESEIPEQSESQIVNTDILEEIYKIDNRSRLQVCHKIVRSLKGDEVTAYILLQYQDDRRIIETDFEKFDCENYKNTHINWSLAGSYGLGITTQNSKEESFYTNVFNLVGKVGYGQFGIGMSADIGGIGSGDSDLEDFYTYWSIKGRVYYPSFFYVSCGYGTVIPEFRPSQMFEDDSNWIIEGYELKKGWSVGAGIDWRFGKYKLLKLGCSADYAWQTNTWLIQFLNFGLSFGK